MSEALDILWQETFAQTFDLFRPTVNPNADGAGTPGDRGWQVVGRAYPYFHLSTRNFSEPFGIGRAIQPSMISVEWGYSTPGCPWRDQDVIRDTTPAGELAGSVYRVLGTATRFDAIPVPEAGYSMVELRQLPHAPEDLPA